MNRLVNYVSKVFQYNYYSVTLVNASVNGYFLFVTIYRAFICTRRAWMRGPGVCECMCCVFSCHCLCTPLM